MSYELQPVIDVVYEILNSSSSSNSTAPSRAEQTLSTVTLVFDWMTFCATGLYLIFFVARTLYTFPYRAIGQPFKTTWSRIQSECYLFARPVARLLTVLVFTEFMSTAPELIANIIQTKHPGSDPSKAACFYQGFSTQFFGFASHIWSLMVAIWMFWILVLQKRNHVVYLEIASHVISWTVTIGLAIIPMAMGLIGTAGHGICWITNANRTGKVMRFAVFYIPLWMCILAVCVLYLITMIYVAKKQFNSFSGSSYNKQRRHVATSMALYIKLLGFPLFYAALWIFPTIRRILESATGKAPLWLKYMHSFNSMQGFWHTMIYFVSEIVGTLIDRMRRTETMITEQNLAMEMLPVTFVELQDELMSELKDEIAANEYTDR
jgi:hypothetical protein